MSGLAPAVQAAAGAPDEPEAGRGLTLGFFLRREVRRVFSRPFDELLTCLANVALVCIGWFLLPEGLKDWLFELRAQQAFPIVLCIWMLADTPATNVLGADPDLALQVLDSRPLLRRYLWAKHMVLMAVVVPVCVGATIALGIEHSRYSLIVFGCALVFIVPIGTLVVSSLQGILLPYHQLPVRWRWENRWRVRMTARWAALLVLPYATVPFVAGAIVSPSIAVLRSMSSMHNGLRRPSTPGLLIAALIAVLMAALFVWIGQRVTWWVVRWRRHALSGYLRNVQRG
jgi:hypothetical protein